MNVYELASKKSDISTQILYGEKFSVIGRKKVFLKIRTDFDNYVGFIKKEKFNKLIYKLSSEQSLSIKEQIETSALLISLNKTCFNGIYRKNK